MSQVRNSWALLNQPLRNCFRLTGSLLLSLCVPLCMLLSSADRSSPFIVLVYFTLNDLSTSGLICFSHRVTTHSIRAEKGIDVVAGVQPAVVQSSCSLPGQFLSLLNGKVATITPSSVLKEQCEMMPFWCHFCWITWNVLHCFRSQNEMPCQKKNKIKLVICGTVGAPNKAPSNHPESSTTRPTNKGWWVSQTVNSVIGLSKGKQAA